MSKSIYRFDASISHLYAVEDSNSVVVASANGQIKVLSYAAEERGTPSTTKRKVDYNLKL
jgi:hypothetical protein